MKVETTLSLSRETKNTFRYDEDGDEANFVIRSMYVSKAALNGTAAPKSIKVVLTAA